MKAIFLVLVSQDGNLHVIFIQKANSRLTQLFIRETIAMKSLEFTPLNFKLISL